ncbi:MAG: hypothetical protein JWO12_2926, partial [Frankiales bacterium]|nr:hypothetical protein [Frankiales bacterium]
MTVVRFASSLHLASGASAVLAVEITNDGDRSRDYVVRAVGLDPSWGGAPLWCGPIQAGDTGVAEVTVQVPAGSPAGTFPFLMTVQEVSPADGRGTGPVIESDAEVVVGDASRLTMRLEPAEPTGVGYRRFRVLLENGTRESLVVSLTSEAARDLALRYSDRPIALAPGAATRVRVHAQVRRRMFGPRRRLPFVLVAQGTTTPARVDSTFVAKPAFSSGLTKVLAVLAVVALWASVSLVALNAISKHTHKSTAAQTVLAAPKSSGGASTGAGGTDNVAPGSAAGSSAVTDVASSRLNGLVTGPHPDGVTVTLTPTALPAEASEGAHNPTAPASGGLVPAAYTSSYTSAATSPLTKLNASLLSHKPRPVLSTTKATTTHADGSWEIAGVTKSGYYLLTFSKPGYQTLRYVLTQDGSELPPMKTALVAGPGSASGTVRSGGALIGGATVVLTDGRSTLTTSTGTEGAGLGHWSVGGLSTPGTYLVSASAPRKALASRLVTLKAGDSSRAVDLALTPGVESLSGHLEQNAGGTEPVKGGVTITATSGTVTRTATSLTSATAPDLAGDFTLPDVPLGTYTVTFSAPGFADVTQKVVLDGHASAVVLPARTLQLAGATLRGVISDSASKAPLVGAGVVLKSSTTTYKMTTADDGTYQFDGIEPGSYVVSAEKYKHAVAYSPVTVTAEHPITLDLALVPVLDGVRKGSIQGEVADARTTGLVTCPVATPACITLTITDASPPVAPVKVDGKTPYVLPASGTGLDVGLYHVTISAPGYDSATIPVQVPLDGVGKAPRVALQPKAALVGTVTPGAAAPLPSAVCIVALPTEATVAPTLSTGCTVPAVAPGATRVCTSDVGTTCALVRPSGDYSMPDLPHPGPYFVYVVPVESVPAEWIPLPGVPVTFAQGETRRYDATLNRHGRIHVLVRAPAPGGGLQAPLNPVPVTITPVTGGGPTPQPSYVTSTTKPGDLLVTGLTDGAYRVSASGSPLGGAALYVGTLATLDVGTNQTAESSLVMTQTLPSVFVGKVDWNQNGTPIGIAGAAVSVTGVTSYTGTTENPENRSITTNAVGCYAVTADGTGTGLVGANAPPVDCGTLVDHVNIAALPLAGPKVTIKADATAVQVSGHAGVFGEATIAATAGSGLIETTVTVQGVPFSGSLATTGSAPDFTDAKVVVTSAAAGSGSITVTPDHAGALTWHDTATGNVVNVVHPGTYRLTAHVADHDDVGGELDCRRADDGAPVGSCSITLTVQDHVDLPVAVRDSAGHAVPGAIVVLSGGGVATTTLPVPPGTDQVTFPGLSAESQPYSLRVRAPGFDEATSVVDHELVSGVATAVHVVTLSRLGSIHGVLRGRIGGQLAPLSGITVTAVSGGETFSAVTRADGSFLVTGTTEHLGLPLDSAAVWHVSTVLPSGSGYDDTGAGSGDLQFDATALTDETKRQLVQDLELVAKPVAVDITVKDDRTPGGSLVNDATVLLTSPAGTSTVAALDPSRPGVYAVGSLVPTTYSLTVTAPDHAPLTTSITLDPATALSKVTVLLADRRNAIAVHVLGQTGSAAPAPLPGALVAITSGGLPVPGSPFTTSALGDVQASGLSDGTFHIVVTGPAGSSYSSVARDITLASGQLAGLEATLQQQLPAVVVELSSTSGDSMEGAHVALVATGTGAISQAAQEAVTTGGSVGTTFAQVAPGAYRITTTGPAGHQPSSTAVTILASDAPSVTKSVSVAETKLALTVSGASTTKAAVAVTSPDGSVLNLSLLGDGTEHDVYVPPGTWTVSAAAPGYTIADQTGSVSGPVALAMVASQTGTATVSVTEGGTALKNATVTVEGSSTVYSTGPGAADVVIGGLASGAHDITVLTP